MAASGAKKRRSPLKWVVALVVVALVAGTAAAAAVLLTGASGTPSVLAWTPADSVAYTELRLDLPGNQQAELAKVVSAFPGFDDQAAFPTKINEILDQLVGRASDGKQSYTADIEPWFGGQLERERRGDARPGPTPSRPASSPSRASRTPRRPARGPAASLQETGATSTTETYNGVTITIVKPGGRHQRHGRQGADRLRRHRSRARPRRRRLRQGRDRHRRQDRPQHQRPVPDRLGDPHGRPAGVRLHRHRGHRRRGAPRWPRPSSGMPVAALPAFLDDLYPPWMAVARSRPRTAPSCSRRASRTSRSSARPPTRSRPCPSLVPADTVALVDAQDLGGGLKRLKALLASDPSLSDGVQQVDDALKLVGGFDAVVGWIGEAGIAITDTNGTVAGGLVVVPTSAADAEPPVHAAARVHRARRRRLGHHDHRRVVQRRDDQRGRPGWPRRARRRGRRGRRPGRRSSSPTR